MSKIFDYDQIADAYERIRKNVHNTPVFTSSTIDDMVGTKIYFKAECLQKTGAFKVRGAMNAVLKLKKERNVDHVITVTTGNHGAGVAFAAQTAGIRCTIVLPGIVSKMKMKETILKGYGAEVVYSEPTWAAGFAMCQRICEETGATFIHPSNNYDIIAGQGTLGLEFLEQVPQLDAIIVPVGGGSMSSGISTWAKHVKPDCKIFTVEPKGKNLGLSFTNGMQTNNGSQFINTIADGMSVPAFGDFCFPIMSAHCEKTVFTVTDAEITRAMKLAYQRLKLAIEPSGATGIAALFGEAFRVHQPHLKHVGVVLCGGNVNLDQLPWIKHEHKEHVDSPKSWNLSSIFCRPIRNRS